MPPKFGTSGLRGLVTELTNDLVTAHVQAFLAACPVGTGLFVGRDLRPSSPAIASMVIEAACARGVDVTDCGDILTPALALAAMEAGAGAVMITGSHIPADRNGLKFYTPQGEITKAHEADILAALGPDSVYEGPIGQVQAHGAAPAYVDRYVTAFGAKALSGMTIGAYSHSTVGRDVLTAVLRGLGATVVELGRSETFIPVDTEAVDAETRQQLIDWAAAAPLDAIVSMDGDGDRPLLADATGRVIPGDVLGQITAGLIGARRVVTPVSSNTGVEASETFDIVLRTRIGSPFVIAGMQSTGGAVVGYEANGGFLLGFAADGPAGPLPPLMTRDAVLPLVATLAAARGRGVTALMQAQPPRFTAADRLQGVATGISQALVAQFDTDQGELADFLSALDGQAAGIDRTDGLRVSLQDGRIVHLRPSGNAPELRLYVEADSPDAAEATLAKGLDALRARTGG